MHEESNESKIDVRIIVSNLEIAEIISKAVNNIQLERDFNIVVSSIIPTVELGIVKKVVDGADILLIGGYGCDETFNILFNELKTDFNHVALLNYNNIIVENESYDFKLAEKEIMDAIIKSTLSYSFNLVNIHSLESKLMEVTRNYNNLLDDYNQLIKDYDIVSSQNKELLDEIEDVKADFSSFKLRYEGIYSKDILEVFNLEELWQKSFHQELSDIKQIVLATDKFKPENIILGQGYIAAESEQKAVEWLKIVRTALIFVDENKDEFNNQNESSQLDEDYNVSNDFENFWD